MLLEDMIANAEIYIAFPQYQINYRDNLLYILTCGFIYGNQQ